MLSERQQRTPKGFGHILLRTAEGGFLGMILGGSGLLLSFVDQTAEHVSFTFALQHAQYVALTGAIIGMIGGGVLGSMEVRKKKRIINF